VASADTCYSSVTISLLASTSKKKKRESPTFSASPLLGGFVNLQKVTVSIATSGGME